jgi:predicted acyl esterase
MSIQMGAPSCSWTTPCAPGIAKALIIKKLLVPGEVAKLAWDIGWTSIIFNKGHRIRITIASTGAPFYEPNPQTGGPITHFVTEPGPRGHQYHLARQRPRLPRHPSSR